MTVRVLFFGPLADRTGSRVIELTLADSPTVQSLLDEVFRRWPALRDWDPGLLVAVNLSYAGRGDRIPAGAEVAVMPPVQGG
jgi:molybdopterin synthase sulfur carrier subunit